MSAERDKVREKAREGAIRPLIAVTAPRDLMICDIFLSARCKLC